MRDQTHAEPADQRGERDRTPHDEAARQVVEPHVVYARRHDDRLHDPVGAVDRNRRTVDAREIAAAARRGPVLVVTRARYARGLEEAGVVLEQRLDTRRHLLYATVPVP